MARSVTLSEALYGRAEPQLSINWVVDSLTVGQEQGASIFTQDWLRTHVESIDLPFKFFDVDSRHIQASKLYYAGFNNINAFNAVFYEDINGATLKKFLRWQSLIVDGANNYNPAAKYKAKLVLTMLDGIQDREAVTVNYNGIWPSQIDPITLGSDQAEAVKIRVSFSLDSINFQIGKDKF